MRGKIRSRSDENNLDIQKLKLKIDYTIQLKTRKYCKVPTNYENVKTKHKHLCSYLFVLRKNEKSIHSDMKVTIELS